MNILLWGAQIILALFALSGGSYKLFGFDAVASEPFYAALPRWGWTALGAVEVTCALLLVIPPAVHRRSRLPVLGAGTLALESLGLALVYGQYSTALTATNPLPWVVVIGGLAVLVAYGRHAKVRSAQ
jgi:hypothetical protein